MHMTYTCSVRTNACVSVSCFAASQGAAPGGAEGGRGPSDVI